MVEHLNILFFSKQCNDCMTLIQLLQNENLIQHFKLFCVDGKYDSLPKYVQHVPTMIVNDIQQPIVGRGTFEWVNRVKFIRHQNTMRNVHHMMVKQNLNNNQNKKGPISFCKEEMDSVSDNYAYKDIDCSMQQHFLGYKKEGDYAIHTYNEVGKLSEADLKSEIKKRKKVIEDEDKQSKVTAKQQQLNAVIQQKQEEMMKSYYG